MRIEEKEEYFFFLPSSTYPKLSRKIFEIELGVQNPPISVAVPLTCVS